MVMAFFSSDALERYCRIRERDSLAPAVTRKGSTELDTKPDGCPILILRVVVAMVGGVVEEEEEEGFRAGGVLPVLELFGDCDFERVL